MRQRRLWSSLIAVVILAGVLLSRYVDNGTPAELMPSVVDGAAYTILNDNVPEFTEADITTTAYEYYSDLDYLGRCGYAMACVGQEIMPTEERGSIGQMKPTGWHTVKYDTVDGKYLYNRCHLLGYQLTGENANEKNLITGTRYMNTEGMLPFENMVADYVKETNNHVLYRVTPIFEEDALVAGGVKMEAWSVEDKGDGVCFNVYVYNMQPGISIDYYTGISRDMEKLAESTVESFTLDYELKRFHKSNCNESNSIAGLREYAGDREDVIYNGYKPCNKCKP